jgi:Right handed beta helix region
MRSSLVLAAAGILCLPMLSVDPAHAQNQRSWVATNGNNANPCTRASPCQTFAGALMKTNIYGEINCVDAGEFGSVAIDKSIIIDCHDFAAIDAGIFLNAISIDVVPSTNDPLRTVRLRGLRISGGGLSVTIGTRRGLGIRINRALHVFIEDVVVTQMASAFAILDNRDASGNLYIRNTTIIDNCCTGLAILPSSGTVDAVIDNSHFNRNNFGLSAGLNSRVVVNNSVFMGNAVRGVHADAGGRLSIDRSVINGNVTGVGADAGSRVRLGNTDIMFNGTGISGSTISFTNNRITDNAIAGAPPTPAGAATSDTGQQ